jgi:hypothetical protein
MIFLGHVVGKLWKNHLDLPGYLNIQRARNEEGRDGKCGLE